jgi:hypothetical protein
MPPVPAVKVVGMRTPMAMPKALVGKVVVAGAEGAEAHALAPAGGEQRG